ncbi:PQQ-binding-like beta-propeller repeat protein [Actinotalea sp. C106]|uniref:outer membrane protein assembly factor BamB family protein n=1 Tax=Actinotalea sp. C106 TaxID=2908644 RepID=UPI002027BF7D|nr:PQQ-binding-like beta-propeller repeat protein [Actinotalea sp. C106]
MTPRRGGATDQVDVELDLGPDGEQDEPDRGLSLTSRRRRWIAVGVVGALAAVVAAVTLVETWRTEARLAALRELPGVHAGLDEPLRELWQADGHLLVQSAGAVVVLDLESGQARGLDARSGAELWRDGDPGYTGCLDSRGFQDLVLVCTSFGGPGGAPLGGPALEADRSAETGSVRLVSRAPLTGETLQEVVLDGDWVAMFTVEEDVVLAVRTAEGHLEALRWHPATGNEVWSYRSVDVVLASDSTALAPVSTDPEQMVIGADRTIVLSLATGEEAERAELSPSWGLEDLALPGGRQVRWSDERSADRPEGVVVDADGTELYPLPGTPLSSDVDDGSVGEVLLVNGFDEANLLGVDVATGERLWEVDRTLWGVMRIGGRAVASGPDPQTGTEMVTVLDLRTGAVVWESESRGTGVTDGRVVLLVDESGPRSSLVAHTIADGYEEWRTPLPAGFWWTPPDVGEAVVFGNEAGLVGLG